MPLLEWKLFHNLAVVCGMKGKVLEKSAQLMRNWVCPPYSDVTNIFKNEASIAIVKKKSQISKQRMYCIKMSESDSTVSRAPLSIYT